MRTGTLIVFAILLVLRGGAAERPDASAILKRVGEVYRRADSFYIRGTMTTQVLSQGTPQQLITSQITLAAAKPDRVRFEFAGPRAAGMLIKNGSRLASNLPPASQLLLAVRGEESGFQGDDALSIGAYVLVHRFQTLSDRLKDAELIKEDVLEADGRRARCYVIRTLLEGSGTDPAEEYWIDTETHVVLRSTVNTLRSANDDGLGLRTTFVSRVARIGEPVADEVFVVAAPRPAARPRRMEVAGEVLPLDRDPEPRPPPAHPPAATVTRKVKKAEVK